EGRGMGLRDLLDLPGPRDAGVLADRGRPDRHGCADHDGAAGAARDVLPRVPRPAHGPSSRGPARRRDRRRCWGARVLPAVLLVAAVVRVDARHDGVRHGVRRLVAGHHGRGAGLRGALRVDLRVLPRRARAL
ncbi:MAG: Cytochrome c oxidase polypeptide IV, partial [uncultured Nocardioidaceae bacterium]